MPAPVDRPHTAPLIAHLVHRLEMGGLENGLINLINTMPPERYRHAIICLDGHGPFAERIARDGVQIIDLHKRAGKDWRHYLRLYQVLKHLQPALLHTRNLSTIEGQLLAAAAGLRLRIHGEHGRDLQDPDGSNRRYRVLRRLLKPLIGHFIAVSRDLHDWLIEYIGVAPQQVTHICNGVDTVQFHPRLGPRAAVGPPGFIGERCFVIGSVGRMAAVKDHLTLVRAFVLLSKANELAGQQLRLIIAGDGVCRQQCLDLLQQAGLAHLAWLPGARDDIAALLRSFDVFVLPSCAEGASNTILEAMASGLPVVATSVGGNPELVHNGWNGALAPAGQPALLADAIRPYQRVPGLAALHGGRGRRRVIEHHSLEAMSKAYLAVYDRLLQADTTNPLPPPLPPNATKG